MVGGSLLGEVEGSETKSASNWDVSVLCWSMALNSKLDLAKSTQKGLVNGVNEFAGYAAVGIAGLVHRVAAILDDSHLIPQLLAEEDDPLVALSQLLQGKAARRLIHRSRIRAV